MTLEKEIESHFEDLGCGVARYDATIHEQTEQINRVMGMLIAANVRGNQWRDRAFGFCTVGVIAIAAFLVSVVTR